MTTPLVVIEVHSGVAECTKKPEGIRVVVKDFDSESCGDVCVSSEYDEHDIITGEG